jgi:hypothetical protein
MRKRGDLAVAFDCLMNTEAHRTNRPLKKAVAFATASECVSKCKLS